MHRCCVVHHPVLESMRVTEQHLRVGRLGLSQRYPELFLTFEDTLFPAAILWRVDSTPYKA